jgi:hypothetical protein
MIILCVGGARTRSGAGMQTFPGREFCCNASKKLDTPRMKRKIQLVQCSNAIQVAVNNVDLESHTFFATKYFFTPILLRR